MNVASDCLPSAWVGRYELDSFADTFVSPLHESVGIWPLPGDECSGYAAIVERFWSPV